MHFEFIANVKKAYLIRYAFFVEAAHSFYKVKVVKLRKAALKIRLGISLQRLLMLYLL